PNDPSTTLTAGDKRLLQSAKRPVFWTIQEAIPANLPAGANVPVTIVGGYPLTQYDPSYDANQVTISPGDNMGVDRGMNQQMARVVAVTPGSPVITLQFYDPATLAAAPTKSHPGGCTLCTVLPGNPGPQSQFDYANPRYKQSVVPYAKIVQ